MRVSALPPTVAVAVALALAHAAPAQADPDPGTTRVARSDIAQPGEARTPVEPTSVAAVPPTADASPASRLPSFSLRASSGGSSRMLFDSWLLGGEGALGAGVDTTAGTYSLTAGVFGGVVEGGFTAIQGTVGFDAEWPIGIVRLGLGPRVGYLGIDRVTTYRQFGAYTFGLCGRASVDVWQGEALALALGLRPSAEVAAALGNDGPTADSAAPLLGGSAFVELRWRRAD